MSDIIYGIDAKKNLISFLGEINFAVGDTYMINGIEIYCIRAGIANASPSGMSVVDDTPPIFVDKNHDLSYYLEGSDFLNTKESNNIINSTAKYGYEWGGISTITNIQNTSVGTGLANTNSLIEMNLQPNTEGWSVLWNKVQDFRTSYGHNWFVPSKDELNLIYQQHSNLTNITDNENGGPTYYRSSSEYNINSAWSHNFQYDMQSFIGKGSRINRARLCYMP